MTNRTTPVGTVDGELVEKLRYGKDVESWWELGSQAATLIEQLLNRVERQREALEAIRDFKPTEGEGEPHTQIAVHARHTARAALTGEHNG